RGVAYLGIDDGALELQMRFSTRADAASPAGVLIGDKPASHKLLHYAPKHSLAAIRGPLAGKADAWPEALKQLEAIARKYNLDDQVSRKKIEEALVKGKVDPGKDVLARMANAGWALVPTPKGELVSVFVVEAVDADAAEKLEGLAKALGDAAPDLVKGL